MEGRELAFLRAPDGSDDFVSLVQEKINDVNGNETRGSSYEDLEEEEREEEGRKESDAGDERSIC